MYNRTIVIDYIHSFIPRIEAKTEIFFESFFESIFEFFFDFINSTDNGPWKVESAILAKNGTDELFRGVG